jgi:hypothetical protein
MDVVQHSNAESMGAKGRIPRNATTAWLVIVGTAVAVSIVVWMLIAGAGTRAGVSGASAADPFTQPAAIEFRKGEREVTGATAADPFTQPAAIEFRRGEREVNGATAADPFTQPAAIEFRKGEREVTGASSSRSVHPVRGHRVPRKGEREVSR